MVSQTEGSHAVEHLVWEASPDFSREQISVAQDEVLSAGAVMTTVGGTVTPSASAANTGDGDFAATPVGVGGVMEGDYTLMIITADADAGEFMVFRPDGSVLGVGTVAVAFANELSFTLADGAADFVVGDNFTINVADVEWQERAAAEVARGVLYAAVDATGAAKAGVAHVRHAVVASGALVQFSGADADDLAAALADLAGAGIIGR